MTPSSSLPHLLDYRLSWHVWRLLYALGYHRNLSPAQQTNLHVSYAAQLENMGLWHEACFVLMHIVDDDRQVLKELLTTDRFFVSWPGSSPAGCEVQG